MNFVKLTFNLGCFLMQYICLNPCIEPWRFDDPWWYIFDVYECPIMQRLNSTQLWLCMRMKTHFLCLLHTFAWFRAFQHDTYEYMFLPLMDKGNSYMKFPKCCPGCSLKVRHGCVCKKLHQNRKRRDERCVIHLQWGGIVWAVQRTDF